MLTRAPSRPVEIAATPAPGGPQTESPANHPSGTVIVTGVDDDVDDHVIYSCSTVPT